MKVGVGGTASAGTPRARVRQLAEMMDAFRCFALFYRFLGAIFAWTDLFRALSMAAITPTSGSRAATQAAWRQLRLQQARQNAERAEQVARSLQARAADAERAADRAVEDARSISVQSVQAQTAAGRARQGLVVIRSVGEMQGQLSNTVSQVIERLDVAQVAAGDVPMTAAPVVNTFGQVTGTVVNTTA